MITDFLQTKRSREELISALAVVRDFKSAESAEEWYELPFQTWTKLEQLQEFLEHLVEGQPLKPDTLAYMNRAPNPLYEGRQKPEGRIDP